jgi:polyisoprenoid-binding protein YceI
MLCGVAILLFVGSPVCFGQSANYTIDNSHTSVIFGVNHLGMSVCYGRFRKVEGQFTLDLSGENKFGVSIDANSVDTNDEKRDEHLRTPDFFNVKQFPKIEFVSTKVEAIEKGFNVTGKLTMHGETREIMIPLEKLGEGKTPFGDYRAGFLSQFVLKRSDYEMKNMLQGIGDEITITLSFEGVRQ